MAAGPGLNLGKQLEWLKIVNQDGFLNVLKEIAYVGELNQTPTIRGLCWKLFLEILTEDKNEWIKRSQESREHYETLRKKYLFDPHEVKLSLDLAKNNPLSQDETSPWNQYFQDNELRAVIEMDVVRTFPDVHFFREDGVKTMMRDILFCYAKENPDNGYKQGMHEMLAPFLFVLQGSQLDEDHLQKLSPELKVVFDPDYIEHDAYALFAVVMDTMQGWYSQQRVTEKPTSAMKYDSNHQIPFHDSRRWLCNVSYKLEKIHSVYLKKHDNDLYLRIAELSIPYETYGIRWIRLLFSREFPFITSLDLWDGIFAEGRALDIVDYVYVAMLKSIREQLLFQEYTDCMRVLMSYPRNIQVQDVLQLARHMRHPNKVAPPDRKSVRKSSHPVAMGTVVPNQEGPSPKEKRKLKEALKREVSKITQDLKQDFVPKKNVRENKMADQSFWERERTSSPEGKNSNTRELSQNPHRGRVVVQPASELDHLKQKMEDLDTLRKYCGAKMETHLDILQSCVHRMDMKVDDAGDFFEAVAALKQVRDLLLGKLMFSGAITELEEEDVPIVTPEKKLEVDTSQEVLSSVGHSENTSSEADLTTTTSQTTPPVANKNKITDSVELAEEVDEESSSYLLGNQGAESNMLHSYAVLSLTPSQLVNSKSDRENEN